MQQFYSACLTTPRANFDGDEESAFEEAVTASVEWNMVHMDLLAYNKILFLSYYDAMSF